MASGVEYLAGDPVHGGHVCVGEQSCAPLQAPHKVQQARLAGVLHSHKACTGLVHR